MSQASAQTIPNKRIALLAGGTGGAKLARGFHALDDCSLTVIANTGDDIEIYESKVCPDPDLVIFHLADMINERGWGIEGDTFHAMDQLEAIGAECWFRLGDRDLAICLERARLLNAGTRLTEAIAAIGSPLIGTKTVVLPMCDETVATYIRVGGELVPFQEFMIQRQATGPIEDVAFIGVEEATLSSEVATAIAQADVIVIGPSNPAISIGPILAVPGMVEAISGAAAPSVVVSPLVGGEVIKGPTEAFMEAAGIDLSPVGIANHYAGQGICDGLIADQAEDAAFPVRITNVLMDSLDAKTNLAAEVLEFAEELT